jgi:serine/threonine-protein kinase
LGLSIGGYRIVKEIGRGGMGAVYEAAHESLPQRAAVKVLSAELLENRAYLDRFLSEARAASLVLHSGLVRIFDCGRLHTGVPYILMEYLAGESLGVRLDRLAQAGTRLALADALRVTREIAAALEAVHRKGIVHRDLKPANVLIVPDPEAASGERVKIVDFGIAKLSGLVDAGELAGPTVPQTAVGNFMGTPTYASPEMCKMDCPIGTRSDVYSLGVMLYQMVAGRPPFSGATGEVMAKHIFVEPPPLRGQSPALPEPLCGLVHEMLAKDPERRPGMGEVAQRLEQIRLDAPGPAPRGRPLRLLVTAASALVLAGAGLLALSALRRPPPSVPVSRAVPAPPAAPVAAPVAPAAPVAAPAGEVAPPRPVAAPVTPPPATRRPGSKRVGRGARKPVLPAAAAPAVESAAPARPAPAEPVKEEPVKLVPAAPQEAKPGEVQHAPPRYRPKAVH